MAVCALVSARARDGAVFNPRWDLKGMPDPQAESFYDAACRECSTPDTFETPGLNYMRACALLSITAIQLGKTRDMHLYRGHYHTLAALDGLDDETRWPKDAGIIEIEERRRLFWSIYTYDVYSSIVWNGTVPCREQQCNVKYATEIDDEQLDDVGYHATTTSPLITGPSPTHTPTQVRSESWISGWNFTTDLYRILEHVITHHRHQKAEEHSLMTTICGHHPAVSAESIRDKVMSMYHNLPPCFKETPPVTCVLNQDRYGFQAANIIATVQLLRMVLFHAGGAAIEDRCQVASEVVHAFERIPLAYLNAIGTPLLYHLGGIGFILGSVFEEPLTASDYNRVRAVMLSLADILSSLDHGTPSTASASERLRSQVARIDQYYKTQRTAIQAGGDLQQNDLDSAQGSHSGKRATTTTMPTIGDQDESTSFSANDGMLQAGSFDPYQAFQLPADLLDEWPLTSYFGYP